MGGRANFFRSDPLHGSKSHDADLLLNINSSINVPQPALVMNGSYTLLVKPELFTSKGQIISKSLSGPYAEMGLQLKIIAW